MPLYSVKFVRKLQANTSAVEANQKLMELFRLSESKLNSLLGQTASIIKRDLDEAKAQKIKQRIEQCGYSCELIPQDVPASVSDGEKVSEPAPEEQNTTPYQTPKAAVGETIYCQSCGNLMDKMSPACGQCGAKNTFVESGRSKVAAGFLALFLGGLGVHRYYLGQWWGIFYIPFGVFGVSFPITLVEAIYFWSCSKSSWNAKYGHLSKSSAWVIFAVAIMPMIAVLGIIAAVALPAYQDYTQRAKVTPGLVELKDASDRATHYATKNNAKVTNKKEAGIGARPKAEVLFDIHVNPAGEIVGIFNPLIRNGEKLTVRYVPDYTLKDGTIMAVTWQCKPGTMPPKYLPSTCRGKAEERGAGTNENLFKEIVTGNGNTVVYIPQHWVKGVVKNEEALLTAGNIYKEGYMMLFKVAQSELDVASLEDYESNLISYYLGSLGNVRSEEPKTITTDHNVESRVYKISATIDNVDIIYLLAFMEDDQQNYYQVMTWSLKSRFASNQSDLMNVIRKIRL